MVPLSVQPAIARSAASRRPSNQSQARAALNAEIGYHGDLSKAKHVQGERRAQNLSVLARGYRSRGQPSRVHGYHLHSDGQGIFIPGSHHGLVQPKGFELALIQHSGQRFLCRGVARSHPVLWCSAAL